MEEKKESKEKTIEENKEEKNEKVEIEIKQAEDEGEAIINFIRKHKKGILKFWPYVLCAIVIAIGFLVNFIGTVTYLKITALIVIPIIIIPLIAFKRYTWILLLYIISFTTSIRIKNLHLLKVGERYIPLALDPHVFLRYAEYISQHGSLYAIDMMRYVPLGFDIAKEGVFLSYFVTYLYRFLSIFVNVTLDFVHVIYPVIAFGIALIFFFLLIKRLFNNEKIALLATFLLGIAPAFLYRTTAGFADKESLATMFMFMALYFFVEGFKTKKYWQNILFGVLAGMFTATMGLVWGGVKFVFLIVGGGALVIYLLNKYDRKFVYTYISWFIVSVLMLGLLKGTKYGGLQGILTSTTGGIASLSLLLIVVHYILYRCEKTAKIVKLKEKINFPSTVVIFITLLTVIIVLLAIINFPLLKLQFSGVYSQVSTGLSGSRLGQTVAENRQPYFAGEWKQSFGPTIIGIPIYFFLFFIGSILLFYNLVEKIKKYKWALTFGYGIAIFGLIFSKYSRDSILNGENGFSIFVYLGLLGFFLIFVAFVYIFTYFKDKKTFKMFREIDTGLIFVFIWFLLMIIAARGASRLMFVFVPITAILASYLVVQAIKIILGKFENKYVFYAITTCIIIFSLFAYKKVFGLKSNPTFVLVALIMVMLVVLVLPMIKNYDSKGIMGHIVERTLCFILIVSILIFSIYGATLISTSSARSTGLSFNSQWQQSMNWVKNNTPKNAVFAHWWDYGYWIQTQAERATILDGGNHIAYWNYLMGREVLTTPDEKTALKFLRTHNATHLLIIKDEIGKYTAYSSIGSDENYDRYSWINTFVKNNKLTQESRNGTTYYYTGQYALDGDFIYKGRVYPGAAKFGYNFNFQNTPVAVVVAVELPTENIRVLVPNSTNYSVTEQIKQPNMIISYNGQQTKIPLECIYIGDKMLTEFYGGQKEGYKGCLRIIPVFKRTSNGYQLADPIGAGLFLSERGVKALWVQLYLLNKKSDYFKLVYDDSDPLLPGGSAAPLGILEGVGLWGPLKIWEINYPDDLRIEPELAERYLMTQFPEDISSRFTP